ncbi:MAG: GIY-YIG nuclease family protein [Roseiflexaceae bacterium]
MTPLPPRTSGVYQIRCIPTGKIYVGSAVNLWKRWDQHRRRLRSGKHSNRYLQSAWNKYSQENFEFSVLEFVDVADLLHAEQEWIDATGCIDKELGFNIVPTAKSSGGANIQTWEGFVDPQGHELTIVGLQDFCERHNLDYRSMHRLAMGKSKLKAYKGWTHRNSVRQRDYIKTYEGFVDPDGSPVGPITNLAEFCHQNGLDNTHMTAVAHGRICSHRGWTHKSGRARQDYKTYTDFIKPDGERIVIVNLAELCRENGLHPVKMHNLKSGKIQRYKGWTWKEEGHGE